MKGILRNIVSREYFVAEGTPHGGGTVYVKLSCGHHKCFKRSQEPKDKARCTACVDDSEGDR